MSYHLYGCGSCEGCDCGGEDDACGKSGDAHNKSPRQQHVYRLVPSFYNRQSHMHALAWGREWPELIARCHEVPHEAYDINPRYGRTALHLAMFSVTSCHAEAVKALLRANRHASVRRDKMGYTPLHYACRFGVEDGPILRMLLEAAVAVAGDCDCRSVDNKAICGVSAPSPLYLACRRNSTPITILRRLLEHYNDSSCGRSSWIAPTTGGEPWWWKPRLSSSGAVSTQLVDGCHSPLEALWTNFPFANNKNSLQEFLRSQSNEPLNEDNDNLNSIGVDQIKALQFFEKVRLLLEFGHKGKPLLLGQDTPYFESTTTSLSAFDNEADSEHEYVHDGQFSALHAASAMLRPYPPLVDFLLQMYPHQVSKFDVHGCLPLHHSVLRRRTTPSSHAVTWYLLKAYPTAAGIPIRSMVPSSSSPDSGVLPLVMALERGIDWKGGIEDLFQAAPGAVSLPDPTSKLYPFMVAAARTSASLDTVYELLRRFPILTNFAVLKQDKPKHLPHVL